MANTNFTRLTTEQKQVWSRDVWKVARNAMFLNKFLGDDENSMVQRITELTKTEKGTKAVITLVPDATGDGVTGDRTLKGREEALVAYDKVIRVDQIRNAHKTEGRMAEQQSIVKFRETAKNILGYWLADRIDQLAFQTLAGWAYSLKPNNASRVGSEFPLLDFSNDVAAPSTMRRLRWDATNKVLVTSAATSAVAATDRISWETLVRLKAFAKSNYVKGLRQNGSETYRVFLSPENMANLKMDANYLLALQHGYKKGADNPLFTGDVPTVDGLELYEYRHVPTTLGNATKWGGSSTVEGSVILFCGAQALGYADLGTPEWVEEGDDYENQHGISVAKILGLLKPSFITNYGASAGTVQDFGVISCYVAL